MAQWGRNDQSVTANSTTTAETSNGAPMGTWALVKAGGGPNAHFGNTSSGSRASTDVNMFGNTTMDAFVPGMAVGVFGVDTTEATGVTGGPIAEAYVTNPGSGYGANAAVTITVTNGGTSGVINAHANSTGRIDQLNISTAGSGYITNPTITIAAPSAVVFNGNSAVSANAITITSANSKFLVGDKVVYAGNSTSTPVGLTDQNTYYISFSNTSVVKLAASLGGANLTIDKASGDNTTAGGATLQGETATGYVVAGGNRGTGIAHAGWVIRREGSGGRAGRVQYETLVAMGSLGKTGSDYGTAASTTDASDDSILPDS
jgi:hypothetical protein